MLVTSGWLGMHANQLANTAFPLSKKFPFSSLISSTVYNSEAVQCLATKLTIKLACEAWLARHSIAIIYKTSVADYLHNKRGISSTQQATNKFK